MYWMYLNTSLPCRYMNAFCLQVICAVACQRAWGALLVADIQGVCKGHRDDGRNGRWAREGYSLWLSSLAGRWALEHCPEAMNVEEFGGKTRVKKTRTESGILATHRRLQFFWHCQRFAQVVQGPRCVVLICRTGDLVLVQWQWWWPGPNRWSLLRLWEGWSWIERCQLKELWSFEWSKHDEVTGDSEAKNIRDQNTSAGRRHRWGISPKVVRRWLQFTSHFLEW